MCKVHLMASSPRPFLSVSWFGSVQVMLERVHPARPGWYEKLYATALDKGMASYEAEVYSFALS
jgi:hypothetical protein